MKSFLMTLMIVASTHTIAETLTEAPKELLSELKSFCEEIANEDGTGGKPLNKFLLDCINEELESEGYLPISKLD